MASQNFGPSISNITTTLSNTLGYVLNSMHHCRRRHHDYRLGRSRFEHARKTSPNKWQGRESPCVSFNFRAHQSSALTGAQFRIKTCLNFAATIVGTSKALHFSLYHIWYAHLYIYIYTNTYISLLLHPFFANISPRTFLLSCTHTAYYKPFYSFFIDDIDTFIFKDANDIHDWFTSGALYYIFYHQQKFSTLLFPSKFSITRFHILLLEPIIKIFFSFYFPESKFYFYFRPVYSWSFCRNWRYY